MRLAIDHIELKQQNSVTQAAVALDDDPAFGIWRDRSDLDIANYAFKP